jgi:hypothetical protein
VESERAVTHERVGDAGQSPVADAGAASSAVPLYALGYPHIETDTHTLWDAQQAGWPEHLPHEAWAALIEVKNSEPKIKGSSADHPAFQAGYAPNYAATQEGVQPDQPARVAAKIRR